MMKFKDVITIIKHYKASEDLNNYVDYIWLVKEENLDTDKLEDIVMPLGHVDIVFNFGSDNYTLDEDFISTMPQVALIGQIKKGVAVAYERDVYQIGISLKPVGFKVLFGVNGIEISEKIISGGIELYKVYSILSSIDKEEDRVEYLWEYLTEKLKTSDDLQLEVLEMTHYINGHIDDFSVEEMVKFFHISKKTLERHFKTVVGLTPKTYAKIKKFSNMITDGNYSEHTYYDQSHLIRESKLYTKKTPKKLKTNLSEMTLDYFLNNLRK